MGRLGLFLDDFSRAATFSLSQAADEWNGKRLKLSELRDDKALSYGRSGGGLK